MSNKKIGNGFEAEFCEKLFQNGYWVHNLAQNAAGQPADVVAVKNGVPYLIDCKVCSGKVFSVSRIEDNQRMAMLSEDHQSLVFDSKKIEEAVKFCYFERYKKKLATLRTQAYEVRR